MRMATFNILHGRSVHDGSVELDRLVDSIKQLDADVLALQEVDLDQPRSGKADLTAVAAEAMGAVSHRFVAAISGTPGATWMAATGREQPGTAAYGIALAVAVPRRELAGRALATHSGAVPDVSARAASRPSRPRGAAGGDGREDRHAARAADRRQYPPVVRARLEPHATAAADPRPARLSRPTGY